MIAAAVAGSAWSQDALSQDALSQDGAAATGSRAVPQGFDTPEGLTAKERLSEKWTDEQRVDNCRVPPDKRGATARPDMCANDRRGDAGRHGRRGAR